MFFFCIPKITTYYIIFVHYNLVYIITIYMIISISQIIYILYLYHYDILYSVCHIDICN